ncbi:STAS domain-containing protein [Streptomyces sp. NPDC005917]|uniref:STAS domain-containing protein n=1 Tax=unclassified Streptomyces TaxID=2593676 RepID=UPI0033F80B5A
MSSAQGSERDPSVSHAAGVPNLTQHEQDGARVIAVRGAFDLNSAPALAVALETAAQTYSRVVVDAAGLTFADFTVLNLLLNFNRKTTGLRLARPAPPLRRVLELTGANAVLDIRSTVQDAARP